MQSALKSALGGGGCVEMDFLDICRVFQQTFFLLALTSPATSSFFKGEFFFGKK